MKEIKTYSEGAIAARIWFFTSASLVLGLTIYSFCFNSYFSEFIIFAIPVFVAAFVCSFPAYLILWFCLISICKRLSFSERKWLLLILSNLFITLLYGLLATFIDGSFTSYDTIVKSLPVGGTVTGVLFLSTCCPWY